MTYKSIVVHAEQKADKRINAAASLARRHGATLIGVAAGVWQPPVPLHGPDIGGFVAEIIRQGRQQVEADLAAAKVDFDRVTKGSGVATEWRCNNEFPFAALNAAAAAADLVVTGSTHEYIVDGVYRSVNAGDILMGAGRPVLVVPDQVDEIRAHRVIVAWKDTREARRALADALPLLEMAEAVLLMQVDEGDGEKRSILDAQKYLKAHGIAAMTETRRLKADSVDLELMDQAHLYGATLIVAGGYGRSRLREWVFGGLTRALLTQSKIPCLLSH